MSIDLTKITTPFGLLDETVQEQLRLHGGPYEYFGTSGNWESLHSLFEWLPNFVYRVKPEPKVETCTLAVFIDRQGFIQSSHLKGLTRRVQVNFTRIDGEIDLPSYRVFPR